MMLYSWTKEARADGATWGVLSRGPEGAWEGMVIANRVADPRNTDGFGYPPVHQVDVMFWNENNRQHFQSFFWTAGTHVEIID